MFRLFRCVRNEVTLPTLPQLEPTALTAGDTAQWQRTFAGYLISDGWVLSYAINGPKALAWNGAWVTNDGNSWTVTIPPASTALMDSGNFVFGDQMFTIVDCNCAATGAKIFSCVNNVTSPGCARCAPRAVSTAAP